MRLILGRFVVTGLLAFTLLPGQLAAQVQLQGQALRDAVAQHQGRVIIGLRPAGAMRGMSAPGGRALSVEEQARIAEGLRTQGLRVDRSYRLITAIAGVVAPERVEALLGHPNVEYVEPDYPRFTDGSSSTVPLVMASSALADSMPYGVSKIRAPEAWAAATPFNDGAGVKVGILDTGGDPAHPDLVYAGGYDAFTQSTLPANWTDCDGHGTHVGGTVAAQRGNGIGVAGVAPGVNLYALKFGDNACTLLVNLEIDALQWATANGIRVINMSFGSSSPSIAEQQAIQAAGAAGVLFIAAAGNNGPGPVQYPAAFPEVVAVAATDQSDARASFSAVGVELDVAAPGVGILSTVPGGYATSNGTSQAAPHVTGLVALLKASRRTLTQAEAASLLATGAIDLGLKGRDIAFGTGRIDALNSISALLGTTPSVPPVTSLTAGSAVSGLSGAAGSQMFFVLDAPNAATNLSFTLSGGTGDADLYLGYGTRPTTGAYICRSVALGNTESCSFPSPAPGSWFVLVHGSTAFSGLTLTATLGPSATHLLVTQQPGGAISGKVFTQPPMVQLVDAQGVAVNRGGVLVDVRVASGPGAIYLPNFFGPPYPPGAAMQATNASGVAVFPQLGITGIGTHTLEFSAPQLAPGGTSPFDVTVPIVADTLQRGVPRTGLSGAQGTTQLFLVDVPPGAIGLSVTLSGSSPLPSMYVSEAYNPNFPPGTCAGSALCVVPAPAAGPWHVRLLASFSAYSNVTLTATYALPGAQLVFLTQPGNITSGLSFSFGQSAVLQLADAQGQPIQQGQIPVFPSIASGSGTLQELGGFPDHRQNTDAFGRVTFNQLSIDGAGPHTLQFAAQGIAPVVSQSLDVTTPPLTALQKAVTVPNLSGSFSTANYFSFDVPAGVSSLTFQASGGTGSYDLKARQGAYPGNLATCSQIGITPGQTTCTITNPAPGTWYVLVGYRSVFSGVSLVADYTLGPVAGLSVTQEPSGAVTQIPFTQQPVVQLVDGQGAPVALAGVPVTASIASGSGQLGGVVLFSLSGKQAPVRAQATTVTTDATGKATFTDLSISGTGTHVLQFTPASLPAGLPPGLSQPFDVAVTPSVGTLQDQVPVGNLSGGIGSRTYFVLNVPQGTASVTFQTSGGTGDPDLLVQSGVLPSLASHACLSAGQTSAEACTITNPAAGSWYVMVYGYSPYSGVTVVGGSTAAQLPTQLTITQQPGGAVSGVPFTQQPIVQVADAQGAPVAQAGVLVTATIASGTGTITALDNVAIGSSDPRFRTLGAGPPKPDPSSAAPGILTTSVLTNASGAAVFTDLTITGSGSFTVQFTAAGLQSVTSAPFTVTSTTVTPLANATPVTGLAGAMGSQAYYVISIPAGQALITVDITGGTGDADLYLRYGALPTLATFDCRPFFTGNDEICQGSDPPAADLYVMIHGFAAYSGLQLTATYSGLPSRLTMQTQPGGALSGSPLAPQPVVQLADAQGFPVYMAGFSIGATVGSGSGTLGGVTSATTTSFGVAAFTDLAVTGSGQHTLQFDSPGITGIQSAPFTVTGTGPSQLLVTQQPGGAVDATPFTQQPAVQLADAQGQPVAQAGVAVTAAIQSGPGALGGTTVANTNAAGLASFSNLAISGTGQHVLSFTAAGLTGAQSAAFIVAAAPATQLVVTQQPAGASSGLAFTQQPAVQLADAQGQPVAQAGVTVTASVSSGAGQLSGTFAVSTEAAGTATFTDLVITGTGPHVLTFSATGLTAVQSAAFNVTAQAATRLLVTQQPAGAVSGVPFTQQPVIQLADAQGAAVPQSGVLVTAAIAGGPGSLSGSIAVATDANGSATFSGLTITGPGTHVLEFTTSSLAVQSASFSVATAPAAQLAMAVQPGGAVTGVPFTQQPAIQLADAQGQPVALAGVSVSAAIATGPGQLGGTIQATSNASGVATFTDLTITGTGQHVLQFTAPGLTPVQSASLDVTALPATQLLVTQQPGGAVSGMAFTQQPIVQVANAQGQPVAGSGVSVTAAIQSGAGTLTGAATVTTNAGGAATFTTLTLSPAGDYTLVFSAANLASATSASFTVVDPLAISTTSPLAAGTVGTPYNQTLTASGGAAPYTWTVVTGTLPAGLTLTSGTGVLSGTPSTAGTVTFTVQVSDAAARTTQKAFALAISGILTITSASPLPTGTVGALYTQTFAATGGAPPYTWSVAAGSLPAGLVLNTANGSLSGTPSSPVSASFTLQVNDATAGSAQKAFALTIVAALAITTQAALPAGTVATGYSQTLSASGGVTPYTWSVISGTLPPGLTLAAGTGIVSGSPSGAGAYSFTIQVSDAGARSAQQGFTLTVTGVPAAVVTSMVDALTGGPALSAAETSLYNCNASAGFDVGDLLCYLDANPTVSLTAEQLRQISDLMASDQKDAGGPSPTSGKD